MFLPTVGFIRSNACQITALPSVQPFSSSFGGSAATETSAFCINTSLSPPINGASSNSRKCQLCRLSLTPTAAIACSTCGSVVYCGEDHKEFDWSRHKSFCNASRPETFSTGFNQSGQFSVSTTNVINALQPSTSTSVSDAPRIVETKDPDIQIIETGMSKPVDTSFRTRKRTLQKNGRIYKDHSKNLLFKITFQEHVKSLAERGLIVNQHQATALRLKYIAEHVIRSLNEYGWAVVDNFLGKRHCNKTYMEVERLYEKGMFSAGQLMDGGKNDLNPSEIRSDKILWFGNDDELVRSSVTIRLLIAMVDSVVVHFKNRIPPFEIAGRSKAMIAVYPGNGTRYVKHVDNPVRDGRCITTIYYCNEDWKLSEHGGTLRLYPETSEVPMDVDPQADRLIFFWSDRRIPHEVLPVFRHRYAITLWYFDVHERMKAMNERRKQSTESSSDVIPTNAATSVSETSCSRPLPSPTTTELSNSLAAVAASRTTASDVSLLSVTSAVSFAVPTRPGPGRTTATQRSPVKAVGSTPSVKLSPTSENGVHAKTSPVKPSLSDGAVVGNNDDDTPFESLRNSQELSDVRRRLEVSSTQIYTGAAVQNGMTAGSSSAYSAIAQVELDQQPLDQQPLDLSRKSRAGQHLSDQLMVTPSTLFGSYSMSTARQSTSTSNIATHSLNSLEGVSGVLPSVADCQTGTNADVLQKMLNKESDKPNYHYDI